MGSSQTSKIHWLHEPSCLWLTEPDTVAPWTQCTNLFMANWPYEPIHMGSTALYTTHVTWGYNSRACPCHWMVWPNIATSYSHGGGTVIVCIMKNDVKLQKVFWNMHLQHTFSTNRTVKCYVCTHLISRMLQNLFTDNLKLYLGLSELHFVAQ